MADPEIAESGKGTGSSLFSVRNLLIFSIMILILGGGAGGGIWFFIKKGGGEGGKEKSEKADEKKTIGIVEIFGPLVVNISGTQGTRYLKVTVGVEMDSEKLKVELENRKIQLTDILNSVFSAKTLKDIVDPSIRDAIKMEIRDRFNEKLIDGQIVDVFFSEFVVQ